MPAVATIVPDESDLLCESCGYTLRGLDTAGNCPECGKPIDQSIGDHRNPSPFEQDRSAGRFLATTRAVILAPKSFYRTLITRTHTKAAETFSRIHLLTSSLLFTLAAWGHLLFTLDGATLPGENIVRSLAPLVLWPLILLSLTGLTKLATWLSAIEARYWGYRLPAQVVRRAFLFHRACYLPVALLANLIIWGYRASLVWRVIDRGYDTTYLYALSGAVVLSAVYLFQMYWIAMRAMMYANR